MPIYCYRNPKDDSIIKVIRLFSESDKPYILDDGTECVRDREYELNSQSLGIVDKNGECFERYPDYVKSAKPKFVKFRDGHREKYDPTRHC